MNPGERKWGQEPFINQSLKRYVKWTEKHQGERRERHLGEQMPSVIYEVRPKQFHNSLKEADELRVTTTEMKSKDDFLRGE